VSEPDDEGVTDGPNPRELGELDLDAFVGDPPAGDRDPGGFISNDQSADPTDASPEEDA
jgi:hypothetical protein